MDSFLRALLLLSFATAFTACGGSSSGTTDGSPSTSATNVSSANNHSLSSHSLSSFSTSSFSISSRSVNTSSSGAFSSPSSSASSAPTTAMCGTYTLCPTDNNDWQFNSSEYCISKSFCPTSRTHLPIADYRQTLINEHANEATKKVFQYLNSIYGKKTLSGQMDLTWDDDIDMAARVYTDTQKYPALMGYDFMNYGMTANWVEGLHQTQEAIDYWNAGGLITFAWHWRDPSKLHTPEVNAAEFYTTSQQHTNFRIPVKENALDVNASEYTQINTGIDLIAEELKALQDAGAVVLWRPLHEAAGGWFWWGATRADNVPPAFAQILLWRHMYDRLTHHHGLNNLIWVWNGQDALWYPGDDYVDISSYDIYAANYHSQIATFSRTQKFSFEKKMVALSETGRIPDPTLAFKDGAHWLWFMVWNDTPTVGSNDNFWSVVNSLSHRQAVYQHEHIITREDLPNFIIQK